VNKQIYLGDFNTIHQLIVVQNKLTYLKFSTSQAAFQINKTFRKEKQLLEKK